MASIQQCEVYDNIIESLNQKIAANKQPQAQSKPSTSRKSNQKILEDIESRHPERELEGKLFRKSRDLRSSDN